MPDLGSELQTSLCVSLNQDAKLLPDSYQVDIQDSEPAVIVEDIPWFRRRSALAAIITLGAFCMISAGAILLAPNLAVLLLLFIYLLILKILN